MRTLRFSHDVRFTRSSDIVNLGESQRHALLFTQAISSHEFAGALGDGGVKLRQTPGSLAETLGWSRLAAVRVERDAMLEGEKS